MSEHKPLKGAAPKPVDGPHPRPEVVIGEIDHTPTILPDQPSKKGLNETNERN